MGFTTLEINLPTDFTPEVLKSKISKKLKIKDFSFSIDKQSLDARDKHFIHWKVRVGVSSSALKGDEPSLEPPIQIPYSKRNRKVIVIGNGPAGFFAAYVLLLGGFDVTIIEQGPEVDTRLKDINFFERTGHLNEKSNYAFGEGGAGTFSDGKLTSRTKTIGKERQFIFNAYIDAGAPEEIAYLAQPHLGSDNLKRIVKNLRGVFLQKGGEILFNTKVTGLELNGNRIKAVITDVNGAFPGDYFIFAIGHSSHDTYRMLINNGIPFKVKPFAIGCRVEHSQELINISQWGTAALPGVKAAEYRLTFNENQSDKSQNILPVYSFCMCPGGKVVPASVYSNTLVVNGMSNYKRNSAYANSAIVAAVDLNRIFQREFTSVDALDWLQTLERKFYDFSGSYAAPACKINDFLHGMVSFEFPNTSYPLGLIAADFTSLFPSIISESLRLGLRDFNKKIKGFDQGIMIGLESKTSSPIQAIRNHSGQCETIENLYLSGEGSGFSGGIISSGADGIKAALAIISHS